MLIILFCLVDEILDTIKYNQPATIFETFHNVPYLILKPHLNPQEDHSYPVIVLPKKEILQCKDLSFCNFLWCNQMMNTFATSYERNSGSGPVCL